MNQAAKTSSPDVVLVLADDLGFSDLGCYGGEIRTPHLDAVARQGVRLSHFYNAARCGPSRASLLTGLHPQQTGVGILTNNDLPFGYPGSLNDRCVTMAEVLRDAGYVTCLAGGWQLSSNVTTPDETWPTRRGFDRFFGTLAGGGSYYQPGCLIRGDAPVSAEWPGPGFFVTDAVTGEAEDFVRGQAAAAGPLFLYTAYTAPHRPLHASEEDIRRSDGEYDSGWDELRVRRLEGLVKNGILPPDTALSERDPLVPAWSEVADKAWQARRMQVYAAQVQRMDTGVGRIVAALRETGRWENTLLVFLSDSGASSEDVPGRYDGKNEPVPLQTRDGRPVRVGNEPDIVPGAEDTYASYGPAWANLSNTPFRRHKRWVHEGGISTPFVAHWPAGQLTEGGVVDVPFQLVDVLPTVLEAAGVAYPPQWRGRHVLPGEGRSMLAALRGEAVSGAPLFWEHTGNAAVREGEWKLVRDYPGCWELYDVMRDRSERDDLSAAHPDVVADLAWLWLQWADRVRVLPWETTLRLYRKQALTEADAAG